MIGGWNYKIYSLKENGVLIEYTLSHLSCYSDIPTSSFVPAVIPGYKKHNIFQSIKYRITNKDWHGTAERNEQEQARINAWWNHAVKCVEDLAQQDDNNKYSVLFLDKVTLFTGNLANVIKKIQTAKNIKIDGCMDEHNYARIAQANIDDIVIDFRLGLVYKGQSPCLAFPDTVRRSRVLKSDIVCKIPSRQMPAVFCILDELRRKAISK